MKSATKLKSFGTWLTPRFDLRSYGTPLLELSKWNYVNLHVLSEFLHTLCSTDGGTQSLCCLFSMTPRSLNILHYFHKNLTYSSASSSACYFLPRMHRSYTYTYFQSHFFLIRGLSVYLTCGSSTFINYLFFRLLFSTSEISVIL